MAERKPKTTIQIDKSDRWIFKRLSRKLSDRLDRDVNQGEAAKQAAIKLLEAMGHPIREEEKE